MVNSRHKGKIKNFDRQPILIQLEGKGMCDEGDIIIMQWCQFEGRQTIVFPKTLVKEIIKHLNKPFQITEDNSEDLMKESSLIKLLEEKDE